MHQLDSEALAHRAIDILSDRQAGDIALLDISRVVTFADYFVIATATSPLQFRAIIEQLQRELKLEGAEMRGVEGTPESGWVLLDFGDVIVHLFSPQQRAYYRLEELWSRSAPIVRFTS